MANMKKIRTIPWHLMEFIVVERSSKCQFFILLVLTKRTNVALLFAFFEGWEIVRVQVAASVDELLAVASGHVVEIGSSQLAIFTVTGSWLGWQVANWVGRFGCEISWRSWSTFVVAFFHGSVSISTSSTTSVDTSNALVSGWVPIPVANVVNSTAGHLFHQRIKAFGGNVANSKCRWAENSDGKNQSGKTRHICILENNY